MQQKLENGTIEPSFGSFRQKVEESNGKRLFRFLIYGTVSATVISAAFFLSTQLIGTGIMVTSQVGWPPSVQFLTGVLIMIIGVTAMGFILSLYSGHVRAGLLEEINPAA